MKKRVALLVLLVALVVVVWLLLKKAPAPLPEKGTASAESSPTQESRPASQPQEPRVAAPAPLSPTTSRRPSPQDELEIYNRPIEFWGVVVDQENRPIPGVDVKLSTRGVSHLVPGQLSLVTRTIEAKTDTSGHFSVTDAKGELLAVESLEKEGYEMSPRSRESFHYYEREDRIFRPDPNSPFVFRMWKKNLPERLKHGNILCGIVPDGRNYTIDLLAGRKLEGSGQGDLRVRITRPSGYKWGQRGYEWSCEIEAMDGGLIATTDEFMYLAPEGGYESRLKIEMPASSFGWADTAQRRFYLKSRGAQIYSRVEVEVFAAYREDTAAVRVKYYANPNGSRNLEYDPMQNIPPDARPQANAPKP